MFLEHEHGFENKLMSCALMEVCSTLDNIMKERNAEGIPGRPEHNYISEDH